MIDHLSYSSIAQYLACPEAWRRKYLAKEKTYTTPDLALGSAVHNCIEAVLAGKGEPAAVWGEAWQGALDKTAQKGGEVYWGHETPEQVFNEGLRLVTSPNILSEIKRLRAAQDAQGPMIERQVTVNVPGVPVPIIGFIDFTAADGVPCDLKTSSKSWTQERANNELQPLFYLAALNQAGQQVPGWKFRHHVIVKTKTPQWQTFEHSHNAGQLMFLFDVIQRVWRDIQAEVFILQPNSWLCSPKYCDFWAKCRGRYE